MPKRSSAKSGGELFIVDNSDDEWKVLRYLRDWSDYARALDVATAYFEIGSLLGLDGQWQKVDGLRILMGDEVAARTRSLFEKALTARVARLDASIEAEKEDNDFLDGVPAIVDAIRAGKIQFRIYRKAKFHAKAYITHARSEVIGAAALVGSSNFTYPGLTQNVELNVQITGQPVSVLQEWYEEHWEEAEDVTLEILRTLERHVQLFTPFEVYAQSLREYFRRREVSAGEWEKQTSKIWPLLDGYQREGYGQLLKIANEYRGAFLCDGVGLGKTFVGLMLLERLAGLENKRVALIVPKSGRESVWEANLDRHLKHIGRGPWENILVLNHTDLNRSSKRGEISAIEKHFDAIIVDEAHNFRNPGFAGTGERRESRYRVLQRVARGKQMFLLTATPVNNGVFDLMHLIELFAPNPNSFAAAGVHSLQGHFRTLEKAIRAASHADEAAAPEDDVDQSVESGPAREVFAADVLVRSLVVQRSRAYVKQSQVSEAKGAAIFPTREDPKVAPYELSDRQQRLLALVEESFRHGKELFRLALYDPTDWLIEPPTEQDLATGRRRQVVRLIRIGFLKRLESSTPAFELSCHRLFVKLLAFWQKHAETESEKIDLKVWQDRHAKQMDQVRSRLAQHQAGHDDDGEEDTDELITQGLLDDVEQLDRRLYRMSELLAETREDLNQLVKFLDELEPFDATQDGKLKALVELLKSDAVLSKHKLMIFTEYQATARYLKRQLSAAGVEGVEEIDSASHKGSDREKVIRRFAPYYNGSSSRDLEAKGEREIRVLIATDVLSEGLNLQDATRLINYDLHWNPVRLMQRIGRVDRRMNPAIEKALIADHPDQATLRGHVAYWNFLPNQALERILGLYNRVAGKTLRISRLLGIEGGRLLTKDDPFEDLKNFNEAYEQAPSFEEQLRQELRELLLADPALDERLASLPNRVFSGREAPSVRGFFFCFALPGKRLTSVGEELWDDDEARQPRWYFHDMDGSVTEELSSIAARIRSSPSTPRRTQLDRRALVAARVAVEKHIEAGYMRRVQAPAGAKAVLKAWMELN